MRACKCHRESACYARPVDSLDLWNVGQTSNRRSCSDTRLFIQPVTARPLKCVAVQQGRGRPGGWKALLQHRRLIQVLYSGSEVSHCRGSIVRRRALPLRCPATRAASRRQRPRERAAPRPRLSGTGRRLRKRKSWAPRSRPRCRCWTGAGSAHRRVPACLLLPASLVPSCRHYSCRGA